MDRDVRADAKLANLPAETQEELWRLRWPEDGGERMTLEEIRALLPGLAGFSVSLSTLSEYFSWARQRRRLERAAERSRQAAAQFAAEHPELGPEDLERLGQLLFLNESVEGGDGKLFVALVKARNRAKALELDRMKFEEALAAQRRGEAAKKELEAATRRAREGGGLSEETLRRIEEAAQLL
jgi:hypothetical protein